METPPWRVLAVSGSLRAAASNTELLRAAQTLAPAGMTVTLFDGLSRLPHFNPDDDDAETPPPAVADWRAQLSRADAVLFSCPEYAHGVPGALKNALDWVVGSGEFVNKPTALFQASPRGTFAHASLTETLSVMMAALMPEVSLTLPFQAGPLTESVVVSTPPLASSVRAALSSLAARLSAPPP